MLMIETPMDMLTIMDGDEIDDDNVDDDDDDGTIAVDNVHDDDAAAHDTYYSCDDDADDNGDDDNVIEGYVLVLIMTILMKSHQPSGRRWFNQFPLPPIPLPLRGGVCLSP